MITLSEVLTERKSALILVDIQNDFCHPDGVFAHKGLDMSAMDKMMPHVHDLIAAAHRNDVPVFFIQNVEEAALDSDAWGNHPDGDENLTNHGVCRRGSWGTEFYQIAPTEKDFVVQKSRFSALYNTNLDTYLRSLKIQTVVLTGVATNVCVETTARHALLMDYHVVMAEDACATWFKPAHDATMANIRLFFGKVASSDQIIELWDNA